MSTVAISGHSHAILPGAVFRPHRHDGKGTADAASLASIGKPGQLPAGSGKGLISGAAQALQQSAGAHISGAPAVTGARINVTA